MTVWTNQQTWAVALMMVALMMVAAYLLGPTQYTLKIESDENTLKTAEAMAESTSYYAALACLEGCYNAEGYVSGVCYEACTVDNKDEEGVA